MKYLATIFLSIATCLAGHTAGHDDFPAPLDYVYVADAGTGDGSTYTTPDSLTNALSGMAPGDDIEMRGGVYLGNFTTSSTDGTAANPIRLKCRKGERCKIDGNLQIVADHFWLQNVEVTNINGSPDSNEASISITGGSTGAGIHIINSAVYKTAKGVAVQFFGVGSGHVLYGNDIFDWDSDGTGNPHGYYVQNDSANEGILYAMNNVFADEPGAACQSDCLLFHGFGTSADAYVDGFHIEGNIFANGDSIISQDQAPNNPTYSTVFKNNHTYNGNWNFGDPDGAMAQIQLTDSFFGRGIPIWTIWWGKDAGSFLGAVPIRLNINMSGDGVELTGESTGNLAQSFQLIEEESEVGAVSLFLLKTGSPTGNLSVTLQTDSSGVPSGTVLGTSTNVDVSTLTGSYARTDFFFNTPVDVSINTVYHIVLGGDATYDGDFSAGVTSASWEVDSTSPGYTNGQWGTWSTTWTGDATKDGHMQVRPQTAKPTTTLMTGTTIFNSGAINVNVGVGSYRDGAFSLPTAELSEFGASDDIDNNSYFDDVACTADFATYKFYDGATYQSGVSQSYTTWTGVVPAGFEAGSSCTPTVPSDSDTVIPNIYQEDRCHVAVWNYSLSDPYSLDLTSCGISIGHHYKIFNPDDPNSRLETPIGEGIMPANFTVSLVTGGAEFLPLSVIRNHNIGGGIIANKRSRGRR